MKDLRSAMAITLEEIKPDVFEGKNAAVTGKLTQHDLDVMQITGETPAQILERRKKETLTVEERTREFRKTISGDRVGGAPVKKSLILEFQKL